MEKDFTNHSKIDFYGEQIAQKKDFYRENLSQIAQKKISTEKTFINRLKIDFYGEKFHKLLEKTFLWRKPRQFAVTQCTTPSTVVSDRHFHIMH